MTNVLPLLVALVLFVSSGCSLFGGLRVDALGTAFARPGNVAAYVAVSDGDEPVTELLVENFEVYENGQHIPIGQTGQLLLDKELVATHRTLLLVDLSGSRSAKKRAELGKAVKNFVEKVRLNQAVSIYAFDGGPTLRSLGEVARGSSGAIDTRRVSEMQPRDESRDLNGAVKRGLAELDARLNQSQRPIRVGTLVVFALGQDLAGRTSDSELSRALDESTHAVIAIGVGPTPAPEVRDLGRSGFVAAEAESTIPIAFEQASYKVRSHYERHYLFAYCSPARAGARRLRVVVRFTPTDGAERTGDFETEFQAAGFGAGCQPDRVPRFATKKVGTTAAPRGSHSPIADERPAAGSPASEEAEDDGVVIPPPDRPGYAK